MKGASAEVAIFVLGRVPLFTKQNLVFRWNPLYLFVRSSKILTIFFRPNHIIFVSVQNLGHTRTNCAVFGLWGLIWPRNGHLLQHFFNVSKPYKAALTHSALSSSASKASWQSGVTTSDHKPVWGMFEVRVKPGKDSVPLAGGLFNRWCLVFLIFNNIISRAVYLEGLKRRSESLKPHLGRGHTAANICNVSWWWKSMMGQIYAALIWQLNKSWSSKI